MSKDREGKPLNRLAELSKKTAKHAGVPREVAVHIISAFIDVLADEIVTTGGASIPGIVTFTTKKTTDSFLPKSRYGLRRSYDIDLHVKVSQGIQGLHRLHTTYCKEGERVVTADSWRGFINRYGKLIRRDSISNGLVEATRVRKTEAEVNSIDTDDFVDVEEPIRGEFFKRLIEQMNTVGVYDVEYHNTDRNELVDGENRLLRPSDLTEETYEYIRKEKLEKATRLYELKRQGKIRGDYLDVKNLPPMGNLLVGSSSQKERNKNY